MGPELLRLFLSGGGWDGAEMQRSRFSPCTGTLPAHITKPFGNPNKLNRSTRLRRPRSRRYEDWYHSANQANEIARDKRIAKLHRDLVLAS